MRAITVTVHLSGPLGTIIRSGPVARKEDLVVVGINDTVMASAGHRALTLRNQEPALHGVVVVDALVIGVVVVNVVHDAGHAHGESCTVVVVITGRGHQPCTQGRGRQRGVNLLQVVVLRDSFVDADVHFSGVVINVNP